MRFRSRALGFRASVNSVELSHGDPFLSKTAASLGCGPDEGKT
jgi:hypothetical protein